MSPWTLLTMTSAFPFVIRGAWVAARLGKPTFQGYKTRFAKGIGTIDIRESGWALVLMGLRHASLRAEAFHALRAAHAASAGREPWAVQSYAFFAEVARILDEKEEQLRVEGDQLGRDFVLVRTDSLPASSRWAFKKREDVPEDLVLPGLFDGWIDAICGERGSDVMLLGVVAAARARAEDFYFPASFLHAIGPRDLATDGASMVEMRRKLQGIGTTIRHGDRLGRNDPCHCGSGKKFKKCHGR
jgi:hypothetical protein